jgi:hypothetical protein
MSVKGVSRMPQQHFAARASTAVATLSTSARISGDDQRQQEKQFAGRRPSGAVQDNSIRLISGDESGYSATRS